MSWASGESSETSISLDYRLLRNGVEIYSSNSTFSYLAIKKLPFKDLIRFFYVDTPPQASYTYSLQARIRSFSNIQATTQVLETDMSTIVFDNVSSSSNLYVTYRPEDNLGNGYVAVVNTSTNSVIDTIEVGRGAGAIAISPDGGTVYVVNSLDNTVSLIDTYSNLVVATLSVGANPSAVVVAADNTKTYVANYDSNSVTVIDNIKREKITTVPVGSGHPFAMVASPKSWFVFVATKEDQEGHIGAVYGISIKDEQVTGANNIYDFSTLPERNPLAVSPDSRTLLVFEKNNIYVYLISEAVINWPGYGNVSWPGWVSGDFLNSPDNYFYAVQDPSSVLLGKAILRADDMSYAGPWYLPSHRGQYQLAFTPDLSKVCVTIIGDDDQFPGLQIIETGNNDAPHFVEVPVAFKLAITPDSTKAYVTEHQYVHPVNLLTYTAENAVLIGKNVESLVSAYTLRS